MYLDGALIYDSSAGTTKPVIPQNPMHLVTQMDKGPTANIPAANTQTPPEVVLHVDWVSYDP